MSTPNKGKRWTTEHLFHSLNGLYAWIDLGRSLHSLDVQGNHKLLSAKLRQYLKAVEQVNLTEGDWEMPWLLTGLPDPRPRKRVGTGLLHPAEWAANVSHLREAYALEKQLAERRGKGGGKEQQWWRTDRPPGGKDKDGKGGKTKKGKEKDGAAAAGAGASGGYDGQ